ncbi:MAG TPA: four helix bundle protein [Gemmatimonadaceae bacterium]|jgi:four helix bundle protein
MNDKEPLKVLEAARLFGARVTDLAGQLPRHTPSGLRVQLVEAAQAISGLLAEGFGRGSTAEKIHYSHMANGSLEESQNYLRQFVNADLINRKTFYMHWNLSITIGRMLTNLIAHLECKRAAEQSLPHRAAREASARY